MSEEQFVPLTIPVIAITKIYYSRTSIVGVEPERIIVHEKALISASIPEDEAHQTSTVLVRPPTDEIYTINGEVYDKIHVNFKFNMQRNVDLSEPDLPLIVAGSYPNFPEMQVTKNSVNTSGIGDAEITFRPRDLPVAVSLVFAADAEPFDNVRSAIAYHLIHISRLLIVRETGVTESPIVL
jgi:hypothetical protein